MEKRLIIAIALSVLIILGFQYLVPKPPAPPTAKPGEVARTAVFAPATAPAEAPAAIREAAIPEENLSADEKLETIRSGRYIITFSNIGGAIKKIELKDFKDSSGKDVLALLDLKDPRDYICALIGNVGSKIITCDVYDAEVGGDGITYTLKVGGVEIIKRYTIDRDNYQIKHDVIFKNSSPEDVSLSFRMNGGAGLVEFTDEGKRFVEVTSKNLDKISGFKRPKDDRVSVPGSVQWVAAKSKYFSIVLKPAGETTASYYESKHGYLVSGVSYKETVLPSRNFVEYKSLVYAGPSGGKYMAAPGEGYDETINYGFFGIIAHALITVSAIIFNIVRNWGVAIILMSVLLNIVLFPLSMKSFTSMRKMHELHPQMEKLKAEIKDNPQKLNKEIMELYKRYKVNPFSGCLPMLLQMPIFIALYQALSRSIELRGAGFLWIKDLSMPDAVPIPITLPIVGNSINILPLLMVGGMVLQQRMSTKVMGAAVSDEQKQQQKMMLVIMPIMFGFIFYNMPSGLVLYWLVNTILTTFEQAMVFKND